MKKKLIKLFSLIIIVLLVFEIYMLGKTNKLYYVSLGDGLSLGQNPYRKIGYGYSDYIRDYLKENNRLAYYTKEYAYSNYTSLDLMKELDNNNKMKKDLRESDLVTLSIGANDILDRISFNDIEIDKLLNLKENIKEIIPNLENCLKEIRKYAKNKIIIVGYYNPIPFLFNTSGSDIDKLFASFDQEYNRLAKKYDCEYISIYQLFKKHSEYLSNPSDFHPNTIGYKGIYKEILRKM